MAALILAGCGGGGGESGGKSAKSQADLSPTSTGIPPSIAPPPAGGDQCLSGTSLVPCDSLNSGVALAIGTSGGSGGYCLSGLFYYGPCDPMGPTSSGAESPAISYSVKDLEPNNDTGTATIANLATRQARGQRTGFSVRGSVDMLNDGVDVFALMLPARARLDINLCFEEEGCGWNNPDYPDPLIGVSVASVRILDQFGNEVFSTGDTQTPGNAFKAELEGGVMYYLMIAAEGSSTSELQYFLRVLESYYQPEVVAAEPAPEPPPIVAPLPPTLNAWVVSHDSIGQYLDVQLDWTIPLQNDDGTVLDDLAGYNVYLVQDELAAARGEWAHVITIDDPLIATSTYNLIEWEGMSVCMTAFNSKGVESELSDLFLIERGPEPGKP